ncbi:uncharacterized protein LOC142228233 [Haematobia irritans]|uniref:uncharacterized protein LOC142228233 n=1 Tax=Haematobia irritans TaxID=7368 RepID=UPI003F5078E8
MFLGSMLSRKYQLSIVLATFVLFSTSAIVAAGNYRSNIWHEGPINCYTCLGEEECSNGIGAIQKCENNDEQVCVTVFNEDGGVIQRGCSDKIPASQYSAYCNENGEKCPTCSSSGCNDATHLDQYTECFICDSSLDKNCVLNPMDITTKVICNGGCMTALYPTSNASSPNYNLVRSCLNDKDMDDQANCLNGINKNCVGCTNEANCNTASLPEVRHSCYRCLGAACEDPEPEECIAFNENDQCFTRFESGNNDVVELGCLSDFDSEEAIIELVKKKSLLTCNGVNCNGFENLPKQFDCSRCSSIDEVSCATDPTTITTVTKCATMPYTQCYQRIRGDATERGCLSELNSDDFYNCLTGADEKCKICAGNICNEEIIPNDRLTCHRCDSDSDSSCHNSPAASSVCPSYKENDGCVAVYENGRTKRGCQSEFQCDANSMNCQLCSSDNCNTANIKKRVDEIYGIFQDLPLNCNTCSGDECQTGARNPRKCEGDIYQDCMTVFDTNGLVIRRGCENVILEEHETHCNEIPELCFKCKSNGCNDITDHQQSQECLYCDASTNPDCLFNPSAITTTRQCALGCVSSLYPRKTDPTVYDFVRTCFEDIEFDDRDKCDNADNCAKCSNNKCNTVILPEEGRLSCYHCETENCDTPQPHQCQGYATNDQCYMYFDNTTYSVVRMGCRSEFTLSEILAEAKQFFVCDGDNCNTYENLPEAKFCYTCDSASDINCAIQPSLVTNLSRCQIYPYTECYTRVRNDGHTERGCLYSLELDDFLSCNNGESDSKCRICADSECNQSIYPSSRQQCYRCDSTNDDKCEGDAQLIQACPVFYEDDECVTQWIDGITRRGCSSEFTCEGLGRKRCLQCSDNACNHINLAEQDIGPVGVFTDLPLSCYHCNGTEDCQESKGSFRVCVGNDQQTCTVAFNAEGNVIERGCSDVVDRTCEAAGNICYDCKSPGCNSAVSEADYTDCIYCDSQNNDDCISDVSAITRTRKCYKSCMTTLYPRTRDENPVYELMRTCLDDKELDDRDICESSNDPKCKSCTGDRCNKDAIGIRRSCYQCKGDECQTAQPITCRAVMDNDQCFVQFDESGSITELGCKSKYNPLEVETLVKAQYLWLCDDDNCNSIDNVPQSQTCILCSSLSDGDCATNPKEVETYTTCNSLPYTKCYSRVLNSGHTERGCLSNLEDEQFYNCLYNTNSTECLSCEGMDCNNQIYPSDRATCHICSSEDYDACEFSPNSPEICLKYDTNEKCVTTINKDGFTIRGCHSQLTCDSSDPSSCHVCEGNDCNTINLKRKSDGKPGQWQSLPLTCFTCTSVDDCKSRNTPLTCNGNDYCMTVFNSDGEVVTRGCSSDVEQDQGSFCDMNSGNCFNCNSNLCNSASALNDYNDCVYCDSETNSNCALNPEVVKTRRKCNGNCMTALYSAANNSIYEVVRSCLDDKDEPDQNICSSGSSNECKACSGPSCNIEILPENRLSCYSCTGESCVDPEPSVCLRYKSDDQCFMLFDDRSDLIKMGCVSDLEDSFVSNNIHRLYMCSSENNCNSFENIPKATMCAVCNSNDDPDCASLPQNIPSLTQCTVLPNTQCYTKVNTDGSTQRGCVSSLNQAQMLSCISGTSSDCSSCEGDRCNIQIFPSDRRRCQRCNTKDDPGCEASPNASSVCPVFDNTQFCATKLVNGHTYRGCSNEFQCDDTDKQYCRHCYHSNDCNNVDLVSSNIGFPGKWQDVPINCYNCQDSDCQGSSVGSIGKCENNNQQNCGTVFASNGSVVFRGCSDSIYNSEYLDYCDENPSFCKFCKSSGCNNAFNVADYQDCLYCDGLENTDCIFHPENIQRTRSCHKGCMTALYPRSDEDNPAFELSRGCLDDLDLDDREECLEGSMQNCHACQDPMCNVVKIPENRQKCNFCIGMDCEEPKSMECTAFRENEQCFTLFADENNVQRMGCVSDLDNAFLVGNRRNLLVCDGDNCNNFDNFPKQIACRWCNSSVDPECSSNPISVIATVCHLFPNTECFTRIDKDGVTHRGCLSDVNDELYDECMSGINGCEICSTNDCNNQIFPEGRRSCIRCDSALFSACEDNSIQFAETCPLFKDNDSCVTKLEGDRITRGCTSEFTCDTSDRDTCRICNSTDNCNTVNLLNAYIGVPGKWQGLPLNCYTCEGDECINSNGVVNVCNGNNLQTCTVVFGLTGAVEKRGCSDAITSSHNDYCDQYPERCIHCKSNGCNTANSLDEYNDCYYCDSANSASCSVNFDTSIGRTRKCHGDCMVALYPRNSGNDPAYELTRTCLDDMDMDDRELCSNGENDFCQSCTGARCNTMNVPETRFECFTCADNDCEDMELRECRAYHPNDQCYTLFSNESNVIAMGCRSEYEMDTVLELVKQKQMLLCNEKGCNSPDAIPTMKSCSVCNSEDNALCAINPNLVANVQRCSSLPYTECFTRINIYGHTERGCLSGLTDPDIFYGCLIGSDGLCETCMGDKCNEIDVYPADRRTCHQCSSTSDPLCGTSPNSNKVCALYAENDSCISNYRNGVTTRGCGSSMTCDNVNDLRTCRICNTNGCNTVNFEKVNENGKPGLWQDVPITCYTCQGEEDCQSKGDFRVCVNNPYQNCMSIFNDEGKVIQRGCSDSLEAQNEAYCEENPGNCMACNSNGCNIATRLEEYVDCLSCESDSSGNCVSNIASIDKTRKCYKYCMTALYPIFREENPSYGLVRSCYDDMDLDDRESCAAGTKDHCQTCNSDKCNTDIVPAERHSCYICEGDECQNPTIQECPNYRPDDKCYIRFDEKLSIIALGCRSEFSNQEADYLLKQKLIHLCEDDNCNHFDNLPSSQVCTLCNSRTDKDCAVNPEQVFGQTTCATLPFTECYSRVLPDGATERGCLSNLYDNEFLTCLDGSSTTCKSCKDNNCNKDIFPVNRLKCHICDSSVDGYCENSPNSLEICPLYDVEDMCVTKIRNDITYRGCSSSLVCDATNPRKCVKCAGEGCNTVNLAKKQDDNYGKWQDLPLTCLSCENSNCESPELVTCDLNNEQDCVTIFNENGSVIRRGCADEVEKEFGKYCDENEGNCFNCKSNECNSAVSKSEFTECIYCDSTKDLNCLWNPLSSDYKLRQCQGGCMTALYPSDSSSNPAYDLIRTCLNDKEVTDQSACSSGKDAKCEACTADKCNVNNIPENRLSCYMCEGFNCEDPEIKSCPLFKEADQCFIRFDDTNSVSEMGCVSSFRNQQLESIIKTKRVSVCSGDNCNTLDSIPAAQRCAVCDSVNEASCAVSPVEIGSFNSCNIFPYTGCYTKLTENGHTERGCLTDLLENEFVDCVLGNNKNCGTCTGDGCNREIFPVDRQQCFTCTSEEEPDCESFPTSKMACPIVSDTESCMTALSGNVTIRGCKSDIFCDASDVSTCRSCFGTECNSIDLYNKWDDGYHGMWQVLPLQCHTCVGEQCLYSLGPAITCSSRNINQDCMTVFNSLGEVDRRGCSDDVEDYKDLYCRQNPELCFRCKSNECNSAWSVSEYVDCAFCDSSKNISCAIEPTDSGFGSRKCYKQCMVAMRDQQVIRSCLDDKELRVQQDCNGGSECAMCTGEYCNTFVFPKDRLKCHVCDGESCNNSFGQYCYIYDNNDYCFAKYENGRPDLLGCVSSQNASDIVEWTEQNKLHKCKGNDCNELSRLPPTTECLACDSNKTPQCSQNPLGVTTAETCNSPNDQCVTYINLEGHTIRGCLSKLNESEQSCIGAGTCAACAGSKCNKEVFPINRLSCHICNSVADEYCATSPYNPLICLVYDANDSCVTSFGADGVVTRGCSSQVVCGDSDQCEICHTDNCNTIPLKDSATSVRVGAIWILLMAFATILMGPNRL